MYIAHTFLTVVNLLHTGKIYFHAVVISFVTPHSTDDTIISKKRAASILRVKVSRVRMWLGYTCRVQGGCMGKEACLGQYEL